MLQRDEKEQEEEGEVLQKKKEKEKYNEYGCIPEEWEEEFFSEGSSMWVGVQEEEEEKD